MKRLISFLLTTTFMVWSLFGAELVPEEKLSYSFEPDQVKHLDVNFSAGKIQIVEAVTNSINISVTKDYDAPSPTCKIDKGTLSVKTSKLSSIKKKIDILIEIPFGKNFGEIKVTTVSANTYLKNLNAKQILVTTLSGIVSVKNCEVTGFVKVGSASGQTSFEESTISNLTLSAISGEINLDNVTSTLVQAETMSGPIIFKNSKTEGFEIQSPNGKIEVQLNEMFKNPSWVKTGNGSIDLVFPEKTGYKAIVNSTNGQFIDNNTFVTAAQCENLESVYNNGTAEILINLKNGKASISSK